MEMDRRALKRTWDRATVPRQGSTACRADRWQRICGKTQRGEGATRRIEKAIAVIKPKVNPSCDCWASLILRLVRFGSLLAHLKNELISAFDPKRTLTTDPSLNARAMMQSTQHQPTPESISRAEIELGQTSPELFDAVRAGDRSGQRSRSKRL